MPSGWGIYYVVLFSAVLALSIPAALGLASMLFAPRRKVPPPAPAVALLKNLEASRSGLGARINPRFFLASNAALALITLMLALIPCAGTLRSGGTASSVLRGLVAIVTITGFAALGLLYSARKGDLSWLRSYQRKRN